MDRIPLAPALCRCHDVDPPGLIVRDVLLRRNDARHKVLTLPNLGAAMHTASRAVWNPDEDALYFALVDVAAAALATLDRLERPSP